MQMRLLSDRIAEVKTLDRCLCPFEKWGLLNLNLIIYLEIRIAKLIFKRGPMD